ncbi:DUF4198 domain-containing protein [Rhizobium leguminosarum]|uniref:DUF4198 domain-containing protein n=1 Tax=Rhizobium leguminosarum TaxID=384 RepID=UPI0014429CAB|nr:DUF4198 domain-containing protein [Rhizobium leguminosarum]
MRRRSICCRLLCALLLLSAGRAQAHDFWIEPSSFHPAPGTVVAIGLRVGQDFLGDPVPHQSSLIDRFVVLQAGKENTISGADNQDPAGMFLRDGDQTAIVAYEGGGSFVELPVEKFDDYLKQYGLDDIIAERERRGEQAKPGRERFYRYAKAMLGAAQTSPIVTQPVGFRYEIVPQDDPTVSVEHFRGRLLFDGKPLAGAMVEALAKSAPHTKFVTHSDSNGEFDVQLTGTGIWLIKSVHMTRAGFFSDADWESHWASLTFEVVAPGEKHVQ